MAKLFGSRNDTGVAAATPESDPVGSGKGHATPTRREREAANQRPLVSNDRKAANKEARAKLAQQRERARVGLANGEEKYMRVVDRGPQRRFVRDYVDARFNTGEALLPLMFVFIIGSLFPGIANYIVLVLWLFLIATVVDVLILGAILKRKISERFGAGSMQSGTRWYVTTRAIQFRAMRLPKPKVKRFQFPE